MELPDTDTLLSAPTTSYWLRNAIQQSLARDPVDALNDVEILLAVLQRRLNDALGQQPALNRN